MDSDIALGSSGCGDGPDGPKDLVQLMLEAHVWLSKKAVTILWGPFQIEAEKPGAKLAIT